MSEIVSALAFEAYARQSVAKLGLGGFPALFRDACVPLGLPVTKDAPKSSVREDLAVRAEHDIDEDGSRAAVRDDGDAECHWQERA